MSGHSGGSPGRRRHQDEDEESHEGSERWLVTYADMVTLLMVLFIVMFAMSTVDERKYQELKEGLAVGFGAEKSILNGASPVTSAKGAADPADVANQLVLAEVPEQNRAEVAQVLAKADRLRKGQEYDAARVEVDRLLKAWKKIDKALRAKDLRDDVRVTVDDRGLVVSLVSQHVVFQSDMAELTARGRQVLDTLAPALGVLREPIEVDGHTNQEKVKPRYFPTDWELSLARAAHVLRRLEEVHGIRAARLRATGFGHTMPLIDPARSDARNLNKRVDIVVLSQASAETRVLMSEAYDDLLREHPELVDTDPDADAKPSAAGPHSPRPEELP